MPQTKRRKKKEPEKPVEKTRPLGLSLVGEWKYPEKVFEITATDAETLAYRQSRFHEGLFKSANFQEVPFIIEREVRKLLSDYERGEVEFVIRLLPADPSKGFSFRDIRVPI